MTTAALAIAKLFPPDYKGVMVDVGANNGTYLSNSIEFERQGWWVLCIEGNPHHEQALRASRANVDMRAVSDYNGVGLFNIYTRVENEAGMTGLVHTEGAQEVVEVPVTTLTGILCEWKIRKVDVLMMDIEGGELAALKGLAFDLWTPKVCVIEDYMNPCEVEAYMVTLGYMRTKLTEEDGLYVKA